MNARSVDRPLRQVRPEIPARSRPSLAVDAVADLDVALALTDEWSELASVSGTSPFLEPTFALTWWRHRGRGALLIVTARCRDELVALAPLHVRTIGGLRVVRWLGHGLGTVGELLVRPGFGSAAAAIWRHLESEQSRLLLDLVEYRDDGGGLAELRRNDDLQSSINLRDVCPVIDLVGIQNGDDLLARLHRKHALPRTIRRGERSMSEQDVTFTVDGAGSADELEHLLPDLEAIYDAAEARVPRLHLLQNPWRQFLLEVLSEWGEQKRLTVLIGRLNSRPAAFEVLVDDGTTAYSWLSRFDPQWNHFMPGHLLMRQVVDDLVRRGFARHDLMIGAGPHKLPWATGSYDTLGVYASPAALRSRRALVNTLTGAHVGANAVLGRLRR